MTYTHCPTCHEYTLTSEGSCAHCGVPFTKGKTMSHTPGPWHPDSIDQIRSVHGVVIARCERKERHEYMDSREQAANARLIAAAPELLEALENLLYEPMAERTIDAAKRAITKATGKG